MGSKDKWPGLAPWSVELEADNGCQCKQMLMTTKVQFKRIKFSYSSQFLHPDRLWRPYKLLQPRLLQPYKLLQPRLLQPRLLQPYKLLQPRLLQPYRLLQPLQFLTISSYLTPGHHNVVKITHKAWGLNGVHLAPATAPTPQFHNTFTSKSIHFFFLQRFVLQWFWRSNDDIHGANLFWSPKSVLPWLSQPKVAELNWIWDYRSSQQNKPLRSNL